MTNDARQVGLPPRNLDEEIATFYVMGDVADKTPEAAMAYALWLERTDKWIRDYMFLACAGESRYLHQIATMQYTSIPKALRAALHTHKASTRALAWQNVLEVALPRADMLEGIYRAFNQPRLWKQHKNIGGFLWAKIALLTLQRERGQISAEVYIDSCWGLVHNGSSAFNKAYPLSSYTSKILTAAMRGDIKPLLWFVDEPVARLWFEVQGKEVPWESKSKLTVSFVNSA